MNISIFETRQFGSSLKYDWFMLERFVEYFRLIWWVRHMGPSFSQFEVREFLFNYRSNRHFSGYAFQPTFKHGPCTIAKLDYQQPHTLILIRGKALYAMTLDGIEPF